MTTAAQPGTAVATREEPRTLVGHLSSDAARTKILPFLRPGETYERVVQEVMLAVAANPELKQCTAPSVVLAVARAVSWGGIIGEDVHLVPFAVNVGTREAPEWEKRATPIKDYKFKAKLIQATGAARQVFAVAVYEKEHCVITQGTNPSVEHRVILQDKERGPMIGAYAVAVIRPGNVQVVYKTLAEIDAVRQKYSKQWKKDAVPEWYAMKTVIHQLAKLLPTNVKLQKLLDEEEAIEAELTLEKNEVLRIEPARALTPLESPPAEEILGTAPDGTPAHQAADASPLATDTAAEASQPALDPKMPKGGKVADMFGAGDTVMPVGEFKGKPLGAIPTARLVELKTALARNPQRAQLVEAIDEVLEERRQAEEG